MPTKPQPRLQSRYVDSQAGWRMFFFSLVIAGTIGVSFRVLLSPQRVKSWIIDAIETSSIKDQLRFETAALRLARGSLPQLSIVMTNVEVSTAPQCQTTPSLKIAELHLPFRLRGLLQGQVAVGTISAEDMIVDIDGLKGNCSEAKGHGEESLSEVAQPSQQLSPPIQPAEASSSVGGKGGSLNATAPQSWWTPQQLSAIEELVDGVEISQIEVQFEHRSKKIYLESFSAHLLGGQDAVQVATDVRIPPEVTYGETLPALSIDGIAKASSADIAVTAELNEGDLDASAVLTPGTNGIPYIDVRLSLDDVPLSKLTPLLNKAGIVSDRFKPRFLWLDCEASIQGAFQGLIRHNPLQLGKCAIEGGGSRVEIESATRQPDGTWAPMAATIQNLDLNRLVETFSLKGPDGILSDFGRVSGRVDLRSPKDVAFEGTVSGAEVRFSHRSVQTHQRIAQMEAKLELNENRLKGSVEKLSLVNGALDGSVSFNLENGAQSGEVRAQIKSLRLDPQVPKVMFGGTLEEITGVVTATLHEGRLRAVKGDARFLGLSGKDYRANSFSVWTESLGDGEYQLILRAPEIEVNRGSALFVAAQPVFFEHEFTDDWVRLKEPQFKARVLPRGDIVWEKAQGALENGLIQFASSGSLTRDRVLDAWVSVDYPAFKKLKWTLTGTSLTPVFADASSTLAELRRRMRIDDKTLGLPSPGARGEEEQKDASVAAKTSRQLRALGAKVIEKAKGIVPGRSTPKKASSD